MTSIQNSINSVCYPLSTITPLPKSAYTQWMDASSTIGTFSCIDVYYPENEAGWIDTVVINPTYEGGTTSEDAYDNFDKSRTTQVTNTIEDVDLTNAYDDIDKTKSVASNVEQTLVDLTNAYDGIDKLSSVSNTVTQEEVDLDGVYDNIDKTKTFSTTVDKIITDFIKQEMRGVKETESHYYGGISQAEINKIRIPYSTFKNGEIIKWYGSHVTCFDIDEATKIINYLKS